MTTTETRKALEKSMEDMRALARDSEALLRATAGDIGDKARQARARLATAVENAKATCEDLQEQGIVTAREAAKTVDDAVRSHPYESIGVALGVGLLLGVMIGGCCDESDTSRRG